MGWGFSSGERKRSRRYRRRYNWTMVATPSHPATVSGNAGARFLLLTLMLAAALLLAGCPPRSSIAQITRDPGRYAGKHATIAGKVVDSYGALGRGMFQVNDGTGTLWVYSNGFGVPNNGLKVIVTGRVQQGFSFGGRSFATILSETEPRH
jgi:hypothetical protein